MKMLVAVDLEAEPEGLIDQSVAWAERIAATLHLRYVSTAYWGAEELVDLEHLPSLTSRVSRRLADEERRLAALLERVPPRCRGTSQVVRGLPAQTLVELAGGGPGDGAPACLVVGTHGWKGLRRMFLGSVAERLVRLAETSVLALRLESAPVPAGRPLTVVTPIDPRSPSTLSLERVRELLGPSQAVHILGVMPPLWVDATGGRLSAANHPEREASEGRLQGLAAAAGLPVASVDLELMDGDNAGGAIVRYAAERGADLVVMPTHARTGLDRLVFGSVAERTVRTAPCPVLVVR